MAIKKKPSPAQLAARKLFAARAKAGAFKRKRKVAVSRKAKRQAGAPSPAQLAARAKFVAMVRAKAKKNPKRRKIYGTQDRIPYPGSSKRKRVRFESKRERRERRTRAAWGKKRNPGLIKMSAAEARRYGIGQAKEWKTSSRKTVARRKAKGPSKGQYRTFKIGRAIGRGVKSTYRGARTSLSGFLRGLKNPTLMSAKIGCRSCAGKKLIVSKKGTHCGSCGIRRNRLHINPAGQHLPGLPAKYQRMYEHILESSGSKRIAAATTRARAAENPSRGLKRSQRRTKRAYKAIGKSPGSIARWRSENLRVIKARQRSRSRRTPGWEKPRPRLPNPAPARIFSEFRGKGVTRRTKVRAATGTPSTLAELGKLRELKLRGKTLRFRTGSLAADGRKKLHIVGVKMKYRGNPGGETDVGEILSVTYEADKPHIETGKFNYVHSFGEEGGVRPHLIVDTEGYPLIEGGSYGITADGIID